MTRPGEMMRPAAAQLMGTRWVVLSHPHPQFGGTMNNKVVTTLEKAFQSLGFGTLAYNYRGVGLSEGDYDGGEGESLDLASVVTWLREQVSVEELILAGFSFGSYVTLKQADSLSANGVCTVAPPVSMYDLSELYPNAPWVLIQGSDDEVVDPQAVLTWALKAPSNPDIFWRSGASHFFHRQLIWLRKVITLAYAD
ncbi:MAG: alpha/beta hydrolase [Hydrogenovibrio sp.]